MEWRRLILSELVAGSDIGLLGLDFPEPEIRSDLISSGILQAGLPVESGTEVRIAVNGRREWRTFVPFGKGFLAHSDQPGVTAVVVSEREAAIYLVDRKALYRRIAKELGCRHGEPEQHSLGLWSIGTRHLAKAGTAKIFVAERGVTKAALDRVLRASPFKWIYVLGVDSPPPGLGIQVSDHDKAVVGGILEANCARFVSAELEEMDAIVPPLQAGAHIDVAANPAVLVVGSASIPLPMDRSKPTAGVLLLNYLFDHPCEVIPAWKLDGEVFPQRHSHDEAAFGTDPVADDKAVAAIRDEAEKAARELAALRRKSDASEVEINFAENEVDRLMEALKAGGPRHGRKKQLGNSSSEQARQRVKNNLRLVFRAVEKQNQQIADRLKSAIHQGYEVMFVPPWGI